MTSAEDALWGLRQSGLGLERYVEEFLEISNRMSWHEAALGVCFLLGLDDEVIRCPEPLLVPSGSPEPLATTPPEHPTERKSLPKKILGGGYPPWRPPKLPAPPWPPESPDTPGPPKLPAPPWPPESPDPPGPPKLPAPPRPPESSDPPWPPKLPAPPWPPESSDPPWLPDPPWPPESPDPPWPPESPDPPWLPERAPPWRPPVLSRCPVRPPERPQTVYLRVLCFPSRAHIWLVPVPVLICVH